MNKNKFHTRDLCSFCLQKIIKKNKFFETSANRYYWQEIINCTRYANNK